MPTTHGFEAHHPSLPTGKKAIELEGFQVGIERSIRYLFCNESRVFTCAELACSWWIAPVLDRVGVGHPRRAIVLRRLVLILPFWVGCVVPVGDSKVIDSGTGLTGDCMIDPTIVEVGEGEEEFIPLADGDPVTIVHGPQGGWHITGAVRATGFGQIARLRYTIEDLSSGVFVTDYSYNVAMVMEDECVGTFYNLTGFITIAELGGGDEIIPPDLLEDHELRLTLHVENFADRTGEASVTVIGKRDPQDVD
jgi:hypothetical protein